MRVLALAAAVLALGAPIRLGGDSVDDLAVVHGSVWATVGRGADVYLVRVDTGKRVALAGVRSCCGQLAGAGNGVWVGGPGFVVHPGAPRVATGPGCAGPFVVAAGAVWRVDGAEEAAKATTAGRFCRSEIATGVRRRIPVRSPAIDVAAAGGRIWVGELDGSLLAFDPRSGRLVERLRLGEYGVIGLAAGRSGLWATNGAYVYRIDGRSGRVLRRFAGAPDFFTGDLAVGAGGVFVVDGRSRLRRVGRRGVVPLPRNVYSQHLAVGAGAAWMAVVPARLLRIPLPLETVLSSPPHGSSGTCTGGELRARIFLQGATGSLAGAVEVVNAGPRSCTLVGRPAVRFADRRDRSVPVVVRGAPGTLRTLRLRPGGHAQSLFFWSNWCGPVERLVIAVGPVRVAYRSGPRCDDSRGPSVVSVTPWRR